MERGYGKGISEQPKGPVHFGGISRSRKTSLSQIIIITVAFLFISVAGCTSWRDYIRNGFKVGPNYCKPDAPVADRWIDSENPNVSSGPANDEAWWQSLHDPVLNSLINTAYLQNITLRAAGMRILEARAQRGIAAGNLFPQTQQLDGSYTRTNLSKNSPNAAPSLNYDEWQMGPNLAWELDFWGYFRRAVESADAKLDASIENYDDVLVLLLSDVAKSYVNIRTYEEQLELARKNVKIQKESLHLAELKFTNGATTRLDVTQGELTLAQTEATIPPLESSRRVAANQLCILLGIPPHNLEATLGNRPIPSVSPQVALGIPVDLLRRRPDIRKAEREVAAQCAQIGIATAELYPHLSITGTIYLDAERFKDLFNSNSIAGSVGPSFNWNVLNYGRLLNNIRFQDAQFQELIYTYQNKVLQANAEAENALVKFLNDQQQVKYLATSVTAAEQSLNLVRDQYNEGKTDFNRVLTIEQQLNQQENALAATQGSVVQNLIQVYKALGGGWQIRLRNNTSSDETSEVDNSITPASTPTNATPSQIPSLPSPPDATAS